MRLKKLLSIQIDPIQSLIPGRIRSHDGPVVFMVDLDETLVYTRYTIDVFGAVTDEQINVVKNVDSLYKIVYHTQDPSGTETQGHHMLFIFRPHLEMLLKTLKDKGIPVIPFSRNYLVKQIWDFICKKFPDDAPKTMGSIYSASPKKGEHLAPFNQHFPDNTLVVMLDDAAPGKKEHGDEVANHLGDVDDAHFVYVQVPPYLGDPTDPYLQALAADLERMPEKPIDMYASSPLLKKPVHAREPHPFDQMFVDPSAQVAKDPEYDDVPKPRQTQESIQVPNYDVLADF